MMRTKTFSKYKAFLIDQKYPTRDRVAPDVDPLDEDKLFEAYAKHFTRTVWHPAGTCKMGARGDKSAVVDPELR